MAKDRAQRRHDEKKKYTKRLKEELSRNSTVRTDKGKVITKPTVKDLENIKHLKGKKNHSKECSCNICKKERYDRTNQKRVNKKDVLEEIQADEPDYDIMNEEWPDPTDLDGWDIFGGDD